MSGVSALVEPALRLYQIAAVIGRYGTLIAFVVGVIGWFYASNDARSMARYRAMALGGAAGFIAIVATDAIYGALVFIFGTNFLPNGWPYGAVTGAHVTALSQLATGLSLTLHTLGLTIFIIGVTWWAFGSPTSPANARGRRSIVIGLTLIGASIGGNVFSALAGVLL